MLTYILIVLCLSLTGIAGLQLTYMAYLDRLDRERKKRIHDLEVKCREFGGKLTAAESRLFEQDRLIESLHAERDDEEVWADVLDDR